MKLADELGMRRPVINTVLDIKVGLCNYPFIV